MNWQDLIAAYGRLEAACAGGALVAEPWRDFAGIACAMVSQPHLAPLHRRLVELAGARGLSTLRVLEHGCASGKTTMILWAWGCTGAHGVDIFDEPLKFNRVACEALGLDDRFHKYDGSRLGFADGAFDFVFSQQVIEHVAQAAIEPFYREEGRVLRPGGLCFHQVPHRWSPIDTHTRTWFIHYLPRAMRRPLYRLLGHDPAYVEDLLHLRSPLYHRRMARRHIGVTRDVTLERLRAGYDDASYKGPRGLRRALARVVASPAVSALAGPLLRNLVMIDTLSVRRP